MFHDGSKLLACMTWNRLIVSMGLSQRIREIQAITAAGTGVILTNGKTCNLEDTKKNLSSDPEVQTGGHTWELNNSQETGTNRTLNIKTDTTDTHTLHQHFRQRTLFMSQTQTGSTWDRIRQVKGCIAARDGFDVGGTTTSCRARMYSYSTSSQKLNL